MRDRTLAQKLARHTAPPNANGCTLWTAGTRKGYGAVYWMGRMRGAHRLAWELANGPITSGQQCLHTCDVPACVNVKHLWIGSQADNVADMISKERGVNPKGIAHGMAKLIDADVLEIRASTFNHVKTAAIYGVSKQAICRIRLRKRWKHV